MHIWTKEEAWKPIEGERILPIDYSQHDFVFRRKWFHYRNRCTFSTFLPDRFPSNRPWNVLTIGVFEGMQEVWLMQHVLQHPESRLVSIDPWLPTTKLDTEFMEMCMRNARYNLEPWSSKIQLVRGYSQQVLCNALDDGGLFGIGVGQFDLLIIDGDHNAQPVLEDAKLCFHFGKVGSWLLFDDVRNRVEKQDHVKQGLEMFFETPEGQAVAFAWAHRYCDCYEKTKGVARC